MKRMTNALISCAVNAQLICAIVLAYAKSLFSHDASEVHIEGAPTLLSKNCPEKWLK